jgi:dTDP-4-amino-4,6-dideoxygalactose transaminase
VVEQANRTRQRRIALMYDAAHAFGSRIDERRVGTFGDAEVFSLSVTKALVSVEGGMISSRNPKLIDRIKKMRNYGIEDSYNAHYPGLNGKMSEFHAIVGLYNLARLNGYMELRQRSARYYISQVESRTSFRTFPWPEGVTHTFKDFTVITPAHLESRREEIIAFLKERGVETRSYFYPPVHEQCFFQSFADRPLPRTEALSRRVITVPFYTTITESEMDYVVEALSEAERQVT